MGKTLTSKALDFFKPDPGEPQEVLRTEELRELHDSLRKKQLIPLLAKPDGIIIDGWRRWTAAMLDGRPAQLEVIITDEPLTPAQIKEIQLVTALHRADLKPYEQFLGCRDWLALNPGSTAKELAAIIDRDPSTLVRILSLAKCILPEHAGYRLRVWPGSPTQAVSASATDIKSAFQNKAKAHSLVLKRTLKL